MAKDLTIHPMVSTGGTSWVSANLPAEPGVVVIGCTASLYVGYSDTTPTDYMIVLNGGNSPFTITVTDMSKLWVKTYGGANLVALASYPPGFGPIVG
jgi:hypothetical protein